MVCIATPDRHHAPLAIDAIRAGKDVYCEKPLTHWSQMDLAEKLGEEADKHKRIVQVGTQFVADDAYAEVRKLIKEGVIGKIGSRAGRLFPPRRLGRTDADSRCRTPSRGPISTGSSSSATPRSADFNVSRFFQWRLYWDYAGGPATDLLVHVFTPVFCILELDYPERVLGGGGTFQYNREVPDQCNIIADYAGGPSVVLMNSLSNFTRHRHDPPRHRRPDPVRQHRAPGPRHSRRARRKGGQGNHLPLARAGDTGKLWSNLLDCVKSRQKPYSPIDIAVRVQAPLNMGILSHRSGKVAKFNKQTKKIDLV